MRCAKHGAHLGPPLETEDEKRAALAMPDVQKLLLAEGGELSPGTPAEFAEFLKNEVAKWAKVIKQAGITAG